MIQEYFDFLKKIAITFALTQEFRLIKEVIALNRGFIRFIRPHHMHEEDQIKPSIEPTLTEILKIVENNF